MPDKGPDGKATAALGATKSPASRGDGRRADAHSLSAKVSASLARIPTSSEGIGLTLLGTGGSLDSFNADYERERREQLEALFRRTRAEEAEEAQLRAEYKALEQQLKKLKKTASTSMSSHALAPGIAQRYQNAAKQSLLDARRMISRAAPKSGEPYLMSSRLGEIGETSTGSAPATLSTGLIKKMNLVLQEFSISKESFRMPTKLVCDLYDAVREDIIIMLTLRKLVNRKEADLSAATHTLKRLTSSGKASARKSSAASSSSAKAKVAAKAKKDGRLPHQLQPGKQPGVAVDGSPAKQYSAQAVARPPTFSSPGKGRPASKQKASGGAAAAVDLAAAAAMAAAGSGVMRSAPGKPAAATAAAILGMGQMAANKQTKSRAPQKRKAPGSASGGSSGSAAKKRKGSNSLPASQRVETGIAAALKLHSQLQNLNNN
uniref:Uncharacterized protein n=1 Tax=Pinguiococcus pyrenoidosus TaxID=172671 RepID=A0A7R9Y9F0_9STRA